MPRSSRASAISADGRPLRLLIYGLNHAPEPTGIGKFTGEKMTIVYPFLLR